MWAKRGKWDLSKEGSLKQLKLSPTDAFVEEPIEYPQVTPNRDNLVAAS